MSSRLSILETLEGNHRKSKFSAYSQIPVMINYWSWPHMTLWTWEMQALPREKPVLLRQEGLINQAFLEFREVQSCRL